MGISVDMQRALGKRVEGSEKKTKRLLAGYEKLIKTKVEEINALQKELARMGRERQAVQELTGQEQMAMRVRVGELENYYRLIYNSI
jgi:mRNA-degrading endonuclease RelE of RelBE toxin-antitoxin system